MMTKKIIAPRHNLSVRRYGQGGGPAASARGMSIVATIMNIATGQPIQKMTFGRMPKPWVSVTLETGELVQAERVTVGKPAPGKFVAPVEIWVTPKKG